jgi:predicted regulator of Ras-like GTPase activity (Roadblock/LC7/MglB family)
MATAELLDPPVEKASTTKGELEQVLHDLSIRGVSTSAIVSPDGLVMVSSSSQDVHRDTFAAMGATMFKAAAIAMTEFGRAPLRHILAEGSGGNILVMSAGPKALLVVMTNTTATLQPLLDTMDAAAEKIKAIL